MANNEEKPTERDWRPIPDPTVLTGNLVRVAIQALEEKLIARQDGMRDALAARLDAIDRATTIFADDLNRVPTALDRAMVANRTLTDEQFAKIETRLNGMALLKAEQFASIQKQFDERDLRLEQASSAAKEAVAAALQAAKEAVAEQAHSTATATSKAEAAQVKSIEQQAALIRSVTDANQAQIADIKERITRIEAMAIGQAGQRQETHMSSSFIVSIIAALIAAAAFFSRFLIGGH